MAPEMQLGQAAASLLDQREANALAPALAAHIGNKVSVRVMCIKGISLEHHGLRSGHVPSDTDVLVAPTTLATLADYAASAGWTPRETTTAVAQMSPHALTLRNPEWPIDLDVHYDFPGLLVGPEQAFEVLWRHRDRARTAGHECWVPSFESAIVIWALHSLKGAPRWARQAGELRQLREVVLPRLSEAERQELADRIVELGADEPLRVVPEFAEIIGDRHGPQAPGALEAWNAKVAQAHEATPWLQVLRDARPTERPWLLFRAVWPSAHDLRLTDEFLVDTPFGRVQSRGRRAWLVRRVVARRRQAH